MWYPPKVTTAPSAEPISLAEAKRHLNVFHDDDDVLIAGIIAAARDHVEKYCGARFASQVIEAQATCWADMARLPVAPVTDADIEYVDTAGVVTPLPDTVFELRGDGLVLKYGQQWPAAQIGSLITLTAVAGFTECPPAVKHAMLLRVEDLYEHRGSEPDSEWSGFDSLLSNYRFYS
ncbi:head-tail connector protein [Aminobacter niigataensis]|uniref:head-tail connector protein n=1 Tax=Aminobacter niigataensis TaxID=83265 RepID=UPI0024CC5CA3|nr:head-tail connector protein [Aminobacter niigataensis]CAI2935028.1 conserved protein of unknown function [Aminobacter niigataensis]